MVTSMQVKNSQNWLAMHEGSLSSSNMVCVASSNDTSANFLGIEMCSRKLQLFPSRISCGLVMLLCMVALICTAAIDCCEWMSGLYGFIFATGFHICCHVY